MTDRTPPEQRSESCFSMEIGLDENIRTGSAGLGILADGTIRRAADVDVSLAAATLLCRKGFFRQGLEVPTRWGWPR